MSNSTISEMYDFNARFLKGRHYLQVSCYAHDVNRPAIQILNHQGQVACKATTFIDEDGIDFADDEVCIKGWSENEGIDMELVRLGLIEPSHYNIDVGHVTVTVHQMKEPLLTLWKQFRDSLPE